MAVYVDPAEWPYRSMIMCHMLADTDEELHAMADRLGINRKWFQKAGTSHRHYDICKSKRALAVKYGAIEITRQQLARMLKNRRETGELGLPE